MTNPLQLQCDKLRNEQSESDVNFWVTTWIFFWEGPLSKPTFCAGAENNKQSNTRERPESTQRSAQWSEQIRVVPFPNEYPILKQLELGRFFASSSILQPRGFSEFYPPKCLSKFNFCPPRWVLSLLLLQLPHWLDCSLHAHPPPPGKMPGLCQHVEDLFVSFPGVQYQQLSHHISGTINHPWTQLSLISKKVFTTQTCQTSTSEIKAASIWGEVQENRWRLSFPPVNMSGMEPALFGGAALEILKHHFWPIKIYR